MYKIFEQLCEQNHITPYRVSKDTGISTATLTSWKMGKYEPKQDKLQKIADYFGVTLDYMITGEEKKNSPEKDLLYLQISDDHELQNALKCYFQLSEQKKQHVLELIRLLSD